MMKLLKMLDNPFLLAAEGFFAGAFLFLAINADSLQAQSGHPAAQAETPASAPSQR